MARSTRSSAATERAYLRFLAPPPARGGAAVAPAPAGTGDDEFDEADIWGAAAFDLGAAAPAQTPRGARHLPAGRKAAKPAVGAGGGGRAAAHGSLPVNIPDWSKILGDEYCAHHAAGDWEVDDGEDEDYAVADAEAGAGAGLVPPHELAWRRRAASLSVHHEGVVGRTLKVRDAVWKRTTGFQD